ncbi:MAG: ComEC/Rec2 family competence protein [bacterium]
MFVGIAGLSALNTIFREQTVNMPAGKEFCYRGVVTGEDQNENRMKLKLALKSVVINRDTIPLSINVVYNTYEPDNYLGEIITIKGKLIPAKKIHQPNVLVGSIIDRDYYHGFGGKLLNIVNTYINQLFENSFSPEYAPIAQGLILGGSSRLSQELKTVFARAGILHILAVSGLHIGFLIAFLGTIFLFLPVSVRVKFTLIMLFLIFYAALTGFRPSVLRASLMTFFFGLSFLLQRQVNAMHIVNMSGLIFLLIDPAMLFDVGAQLSFAAVYGIIYFFPKINNFLLKYVKARALKTISQAMAVSFSAQVFVSPFLIYYFNQLPTLATFSNLLIVPLASVVIYLLFILIIVSLFFAPVVNIVSYIISQLIWLLKTIAEFFVSLPFSSLSLNISPIFLLLFFLMFCKKTRKFAIFTALLTAIFFSASSFVPVSLLKITNNTAHITLLGQENILICNKNVKIIPDDFYKFSVDYLIALKRFMPVKNDFIPLPERFQAKNLKLGDLSIRLDNEIYIQCRDFVFKLPHNTEDNLIKYIICGRKGTYQFDLPVEATVLDRIFADLQIHFGYLKVNL